MECTTRSSRSASQVSREKGMVFASLRLSGSCMTRCCTACPFVPLFHYLPGRNVVYFVSGPNGPSRTALEPFGDEYTSRGRDAIKKQSVLLSVSLEAIFA
jgi:hypothetical protein